MKLRILTLTALFFSTTSIGQQLNINIEKKEFLIREPIIVLAEFKNTGTTPLLIPDFVLDNLELVVNLKDLQTGKMVNYSIQSSHRAKTIKQNLIPGESVYQAIPVVPFFYGNTKGYSWEMDIYLLAGNYTISLEYHLDNSNTTTNSLQKFYSKTINIEISEPTKENDLLMLSDYKEIVRNFHVGSPRRIITEADLYLSKLYSLLKQYPKSTYRRIVFQEMIKQARYAGKIFFRKKVLKEYCKAFPNNYQILNYMGYDENAKDVIKESLQELSLSNKIVTIVKKHTKYLNKLSDEYLKLKKNK